MVLHFPTRSQYDTWSFIWSPMFSYENLRVDAFIRGHLRTFYPGSTSVDSKFFNEYHFGKYGAHWVSD